MLFGDTTTFAIEAISEAGLVAPSAVWGRLRIWCQGVSLGDFSEAHCGLPSGQFDELRSNIPSCWYDEFDGLSDEQLFDALDRILYGYSHGVEVADGRADEQLMLDSNRYVRFEFLTNWGEMFDRSGKSFIFSPDGKTVKILNGPNGFMPLRTLNTSVACIQKSCEDYAKWLDQEGVRLKSRELFHVANLEHSTDP